MASTAVAPVLALLGGRKVLGNGFETENVVGAVRQGLPYASLRALASELGLDLGDVGAVVGIPARTLARRKHQKALSPVESDRLYRLAYVGHMAAATLGGLPRAREWLGRANRGLGGVTPISLLDTDAGCRQVEDVLQRLSYGVYG